MPRNNHRSIKSDSVDPEAPEPLELVPGLDATATEDPESLLGGNSSGSVSENGHAPAEISTRKYYAASIYPGKDVPLPKYLVDSVSELEQSLGMPVWLLIQNGDEEEELGDLCVELADAFYNEKHALPTEGRVALLIHAPGGQADAAYRIATFLRRQCKGFVAVIPRFAKSAATLLAFGADEIILGPVGELGPLDVQVMDFEREVRSSALDEVQALERLHAFAMDTLDQTMMLLAQRSAKKVSTLLPVSLHYINELMRPLLEKIDTVHYTQMSRWLKVGEEYAYRLLLSHHSTRDAKFLARQFVEKYPEHGFVIDYEEAKALGLQVKRPSAEQERIMDDLLPLLTVPYRRPSIIGRLMEVEVTNEED